MNTLKKLQPYQERQIRNREIVIPLGTFSESNKLKDKQLLETLIALEIVIGTIIVGLIVNLLK